MFPKGFITVFTQICIKSERFSLNSNAKLKKTYTQTQFELVIAGHVGSIIYVDQYESIKNLMTGIDPYADLLDH